MRGNIILAPLRLLILLSVTVYSKFCVKITKPCILKNCLKEQGSLTILFRGIVLDYYLIPRFVTKLSNGPYHFISDMAATENSYTLSNLTKLIHSTIKVSRVSLLIGWKW